MFKTFTLAGLIALGASTASAATLGFTLTISGSGQTGANEPRFVLTNNSASAQITDFDFGIGNTGYNFDGFYNIIAPAGGTASANVDANTNGGSRVDVINAAFTGFDAGENAQWNVDVDIDTLNTFEDYRTVLWNNGAALNTVFTATFSTGDTLSVTAPDAAVVSSYTFSASSAPAVPLPAGLPLVLTGLAGFALLKRRT